MTHLFSLFIVLSAIYECQSTVGFLNYTLPTINDLLAFNDQASTSLLCYQQLIYLQEKDLIYTMADAWSKIHPGMLVATPIDLGHYDECLNIDVSYDSTLRIYGSHCLATLSLSSSVTFVQSICIPSGCSSQEIVDSLNSQGFPVTGLSCTLKSDNKDWDTGAIITVAIFWSVGLLIVISTIYDIILYMSEKRAVHESMIAFSLVSNGRKLFQTTKNPKTQILCFHGIKFISMMWIIAGHNAVGLVLAPLTNYEEGSKWLYQRSSFYMAAAHLAVDSFFYISGFLLAYIIFKSEYKKSPLLQIASVPHMILHRYLRLTPALLMLYLYMTFLSRFVGDGPLFKIKIDSLCAPCHKYWWSIFLYIQNYYNKDELCMTQLWYVSADMQLFLISPLVYIPISFLYKKKPILGFIGIGILNVIFAILPIFTKLFFKDYDPDFQELDTHSRLVDYFIGFMFGMIVRHNRQRFGKLPKAYNLSIWSAVLAIFAILSYTYQEASIADSYNKRALGFSFIRVFWCIALCWLIYSCLNGQGGIIDWILSNRFMQVGGKLTYSMYLVHGSIVAIYVLTVRNPEYLTNYTAFYGFCANFVISLVVGLIWTLSFELPMITVEKLIFGLGVTVKPAETNSPELTSPPPNGQA
ncbi:nose resistant to fluoxetine protein 6-like [Rhynchophorus ferrugineus]|uniref:nose resistant to fluoxetine protein 6-like n=1 Tax=Rhynchophorus ferrugineus TaxID=354439 RepID=UPI003FCEC0F2